jgi:hypothetical protein
MKLGKVVRENKLGYSCDRELPDARPLRGPQCRFAARKGAAACKQAVRFRSAEGLANRGLAVLSLRRVKRACVLLFRSER